MPRPRTGAIKVCVVCGKEFYVAPYRINRASCCSRECGLIVANQVRIPQKKEKESKNG